MKYVLKESTARRLAELVRDAEQPDPPIPVQRKLTTWNPVYVVANSDTAVGGSDVGDQCYDASVVLVNSLVDNQEIGADVWLTVLNGSDGFTAPTETVVYSGLYAGIFDPDPGGAGTDPRPRVFATASIEIPADENRNVTATTLTPDNTWVDLGYDITLSPGRYEITATWTALGQISATPSGRIRGRVYNETTAAADIVGMTDVEVAQCVVVNLNFIPTVTVQRILRFDVTTTLHLEGQRVSGPTWTTAEILGSPTAASSTRLAYIRLGA